MQVFYDWILNEAALPYRSTRLWIKRLQNTLTQIHEKTEEINYYLHTWNEEELEEYFDQSLVNDLIYFRDYFIKYITDKERYDSVVGSMNSLNQMVETYFSLGSSGSDEEYARKILFGYIPADINRIKEVIHKMEEMKDWLNIDYHSSRYQGDEYLEEHLLPIQLFYEHIPKFIPVLDELLKSNETKNKWMWTAYQSPGTHPEDIGEEETVYHASIDAKTLYENGFQADYSGPQRGLGGGDSSKISVTLDFYIAQNIARAFKIISMICQKKINPNELYRQIKQDVGNNWNDLIQHFNTKKTAHDFPPKSIPQLLEFYLGSMWFTSDDNIKHYVSRNPVFWSADGEELYNRFKDVDYRTIGIIKMKVRVDQNERFQHAEAELNITPEQIISIDQLIQ
jgi:hypothetical protein